MKLYLGLITIFALFLTGCASTPDKAAVNNRSLDELSSKNIIAFESDREFRSYLNAAKRESRPYDVWWASNDTIQLAQAECVNPADCQDEIIVTGARRATSSTPASSGATSITNTQNFGVDEGDIVKEINGYLIVLQDGRLFSIDTGERADELALIDRINVYQDVEYDSWYDELLVFENLLLVTGYSYEAEATELAVFELSEAGVFTHRSTFYKTSDDYYDDENYATRLVDDKLILYTPLYLTEIDTHKSIKWPVIRRWTGVKDKGEPWTKGRNLFDARNIHYPIQRTVDPTLHTVSICPLDIDADEELLCETQAIIGPSRAEWYVSRKAAYLWMSPGYSDLEFEAKDDCESEAPPSFEDAEPAALYEFPLNGRPPKAMYTRGTPINQFSIESDGKNFKALVSFKNTNCYGEDMQYLSYFTQSLSRFSSSPRRANESHYIDVPDFSGWSLENRFTDTHLVYAGRSQRRYNYAQSKPAVSQPATVIAAANPSEPIQIDMPHDVIRAERLGDDIILTGHHKDKGLYISLLDLDQTPRRADTLFIDGRYESEGRSHAFNGVTYPDGSGLMGLPTSRRVKDSRRSYWRSKGSDVSFISLEQGGTLSSAGPIFGKGEDAVHPDYECEVSCVDWYGNTRPVFLKGRVFALIGTELIETRQSGTSMLELTRLDISAPLPQERTLKTAQLSP